MPGKVAIVTGANKGIGYGIVNPVRGKEAVAKLEEETGKIVKFHQLDVSDPASVDTFLDFIKSEHGGFDVLVQNAGFAFKGNATEPRPVQAEETMKINFWGMLDVQKKFYPLTRKNGRHVLMSSFVSQMAEFSFTPKWGNPIQRELGQLNKDLTLERLEQLAEQYQDDCDDGLEIKKGWPATSYAISKLFVNGTARVFGKIARQENKGVLVNCCSPGFVTTDMTSQNSAGQSIGLV